MRQLVKTYSELIKLPTYAERFDYLWIGDDNVLSPKHISNSFYRSKLWLSFRADMIVRDLGCDLGLLGFEIEQVPGKPTILLHHINPITEEDIISFNEEILLNPENVITTAYPTHGKIHYSKQNEAKIIERRPGDTKLW